MDLDENDLLYSNTYIPSPELTGEVSLEANEEFKKFYKKELDKSEERKLRGDSTSIRSTRSARSVRSARSQLSNMSLTEETDDQQLINTNRYGGNAMGSAEMASDMAASLMSTESKSKKSTNGRRVKEKITYVNVDSRDRNKILYPKSNFFKLFLGKTFYNVKSIRLASIEFPNTNAVINSSNNYIYWRNKEDINLDIINGITRQYPIYQTPLRIGSYVATTIQTELINKMITIKRLNQQGDYHYFTVTLDTDTDVVTFTSLIISQLPVNAIKVTVNTGVIRVTAPNHGYTTGETIYIVGAQTVGGIPVSELNTGHTIVVINENTFEFEVKIKAAYTTEGGGNSIRTGKIAPFQLLFGEYSNTVAQNIGYPLENSSELIRTYIKSITNLYLVQITTKTNHNFNNSFNYLGKQCNITNAGTTPDISGPSLIAYISSSTSFLIKVDNFLQLASFNQGSVTFDGITLDIQTIRNYDFNTLLVKTFTNHNYNTLDIGKSVNLIDTTTTPSLDGSIQIYSLYENNSFIVLGNLQGESNVTVPGKAGSLARHTPLTSHTIIITDFEPDAISKIICPNHKLQVGDTIKIINLITKPSIENKILNVYSIIDANTITVNFETTGVDLASLSNAYIETGLITVSFPGHGFNKIISIQNTEGTPGTSIGNLLMVKTQLPTNFTNNQLVRIMNTDSVPVIDDSYNISVVSNDSFTIPYPYPIMSRGTNGIIGFDQHFYLYGAANVGGISPTDINSKKYVVRDIVDENTFTFYNTNVFSSFTETNGGSNVYISSLLHGFSGIQTNTKNNILNRSINLQGENYAFLCCPQLSTMMNTGNVNNIFARISLDQSPGSMVFSFLSNPKTFDTVALDKLDELEFSIVNYDGTLYEFNDLDYSFTLQITEVIDLSDNFNLSSRRGIVD